MKLIDTRIRVETSEYRTEYFPELLYSHKNWRGKEIIEWVRLDTSHVVLSLQGDSTIPFGLAKAQAAIKLELKARLTEEVQNLHERTKQISYIKYP